MDSLKEIIRHCRELDQCNQRGGRMLSVADLIEAGTMDIPLAAALAARVAAGASLMIGANPGGAGKTTVMCALLNFVPPHIALCAATRENIVAAVPTPQRCYICHEIGAGSWYAYLWGETLREYCALGQQGHILATNLHADTLEEATAQVCTTNNVPEKHLRHFSLIIFLRVRRPLRVIHQVYVSNNNEPHVLAYDAETGFFNEEAIAPQKNRDACARFLEAFLAQPQRTVQEMRRQVVEHPLLTSLWK